MGQKIEYKDYEFHEYANIYPLLEGEEFTELKNDITQNGLLDAIILFEGKILDGRNRYRACRETNTPIRIIHFEKKYKNKVDPLDFVIAVNERRRHLTKDQKAIIYTEKILPLIEERARKRKLSQLKQFSEENAVSTEIGTNGTKGKSTEILAKKTKVGRNKIGKAKKVIEVAKKDPEIKKDLEDVKRGKKRLDNVYAKVQKKEKPKIIPKVPEDKYDVIYADPPWQYNFSSSPTRIIEKEYPTMTLKEICKLKVPSAKDSILFLWCPAPKLYPEGMEVIKAWGFTYKTCMVWVKDKIGMGYYARNRHELLLIATKGSPGVPEPNVRPDSVIEAPRLEHSKKPEVVYELLESMYPERKYIELFARNKRENWKSWGNEVAEDK